MEAVVSRIGHIVLKDHLPRSFRQRLVQIVTNADGLGAQTATIRGRFHPPSCRISMSS